MRKSPKYIVVSLPRTGTLSICEMGKLCGLRFKHISQQALKDINEYDLFADTPYYCPTILEKIVQGRHDCRLIYIERNFADLYRSWNTSNLIHYYNRIVTADKDVLSNGAQFDKLHYGEALGSEEMSKDNYEFKFQRHKNNIMDFVRSKQTPILSYRFEEGWKPFCDYINRPAPNCAVPHLHANNCFAWAKPPEPSHK